MNRFASTGPTKVPWYVLALVVTLACFRHAEGRELAVEVLQTKGIGEDSNDDLRMAGVRFDEPLPRYLSPTAMFCVSLVVAFMYAEGLLGSCAVGAAMQLLAFFFYLFTASGADTEQATWQYPLANAKTILSNRGAVGGLYFGLGFWAYVLMGGVVGEIISWATVDMENGGKKIVQGRPYDRYHRHYKMGTLREFVGRGCSRLCCPPDANRDTLATPSAPSPPEYGEDNTKAAQGIDDTYVTNSCMATSGGEEITWGVALDHLIVIFIVAAASGPGMDVWEKPIYAWLGLLIFVVALYITMLLYQHYQYAEAVDFRVDATEKEFAAAKDRGLIRPMSKVQNVDRDYNRFISQIMVLYPNMVHMVLFQVAYCILYSVMDGEGAFLRPRFAQNAEEARYLATQNLLLEFVTVVISFAVLTTFALTTYFVIIKGVVKAP